MTRLRVLIVDDEPLARRRLLRLLTERDNVEVIGECSDGREALQAFFRQRPDLVFLDVQMPGLDGIALIEEAGLHSSTAIVFVTAFDRYALEAFEHQAVDFLLKPFSNERFERALSRAIERLRQRDVEKLNQRLVRALEGLEEGRPADTPLAGRIPVRTRGKVRFVHYDEIEWVEAAGSYVRLHGRERSWLARGTMKSLEAQFPEGKFLRVHRSAIVRLDDVAELAPTTHGDLVLTMRSGARVRLGRTYRERAVARLRE
ncbi:MAG: LytTR family DNA-binding domain-containing protein [Acidobacteriota bacterium]